MAHRLVVHARWLIALLATSTALTLVAPWPVQAQNPTCTVRELPYATFTVCNGTLADGRPYGFRVPTDWNGTLVLISHGYEAPGTTFNVQALLNQGPMRWLVGEGAAVAASFGGGGWSLREAMRNQIETLDIFTAMYGTPTRTIAYGVSLGGIISAGLVQRYPERFAGGLPVAGPLAGGVATWNQGLDFAFVVQQLLGPESGLRVIHVTNPGTPTSGNWGLAVQLLNSAQGTPQGRARIALACAVADVPGWIDPYAPEPAPDDYAARQLNEFLWARDVLAGFTFGYGRADLEARAGGNPSWNTDVNYGAQLERSTNHAEVVALYEAAGLSLEDDLARLKAAPRIAADPAAVAYLTENIVFDGDLGAVPVLAVHTTGDGLIVPQHLFAYRFAALQAQDPQLLRLAFLHRGGHATVTWAETIASFQALFERIDMGSWHDSASPENLNAAAQALGPSYYLWPPAFMEYAPAPFPRPYDLADPSALLAGGPSQAGAPASLANGNAAAVRPLTAWPLPYRGGSLQVSLSPTANLGTDVAVEIYDLSGRRVRVLDRATRGGAGSLEWDGRDADGVAVGSGVYFLRAMGAGRSAQTRLAVIR